MSDAKGIGIIWVAILHNLPYNEKKEGEVAYETAGPLLDQS